MDYTQQSIEFLNFWFSHPSAPAKIRLIYLPSDYQAAKFGVKGKVREQWLEKERVRVEPDAVREDLRAINQRGYDVFYFVNAVRGDVVASPTAKGEFTKDEDIEKRLFLPLDIDYRMPSSVGKFEDELGLRLGVVVTSRREWNHYQFLLGVDSHPRDSAQLLDLPREFCAICGSDPIADPKRILRLPGLVNWKGVTDEKPGTFCEWVSGQGDYYSIEDIRYALGKFACSGLSAEMRALQDEKTIAVGARGGKGGRGAGEGRQAGEFPRWDKVLDACARGEASVLKGGRHNALLFWGSQMSAARLPLDSVMHNLDLFAKFAFDERYDTAEPNDYARLRADVAQAWEKIDSEIDEMFASGEFDGECGEPGGFSEFEDAEFREIPGSQAKSTGSTESNGVTAGSEHSAGGGVEGAPRTLIAFARMCARRLANESEEAWLDMLRQILSAANFFDHRSHGSVVQLSDIALLRLHQCKAWRNGRFLAPEAQRNGREYWTMVPLNEAQSRNLVRHFLFEASTLVSKHRKKITPVSPVIDPGEKKKKVKNVFAVRGELLSQFEREMILRREGSLNSGLEETANVVAFQNGVFDLDEWTAGIDALPGERLRRSWAANLGWEKGSGLQLETSWIKFLNCVACDFLFEEAMQALEGNAETVLSCGGTPRWDRFVEDAFPADAHSKRGLLCVIGYCLLSDNPYQKYFFFEGIAGGGKGTLAEICFDLVGFSNGGKIEVERIKSDAWLGPLEGATVVIIDEAEGTDVRTVRHVLAELARVTGSETVSARVLNQNSRKIRSTQKFILVTNRQIEADDVGGQQARRAVPVYFSRKKEGEVIPLLHKKIFVEEGDLIATRAFCELLRALPRGERMFDIGAEAFVRGKERFEESTAKLKQFLGRICRWSEENMPSMFLQTLCEIWVDREDSRGYLRRQLASKVITDMILVGFSRTERAAMPGYGDERGKGFLNCCVDLRELLECLEMTERELARELRMRANRKERLWTVAKKVLGFSEEILDYASGQSMGQKELFNS